MKTVKIGDILTNAQAQAVIKLYQSAPRHLFAQQCAEKFIEPNIGKINVKLGQINDPLFLAYCVEHALNQTQH